MAYKLEKPYTELQYADFVVEYNHNHNRKIAETSIAIYALEDNEIMKDGIPVINPNYDNEQEELANQIRIEEIKQQLINLDAQAIRPLRAVLAGTNSDEDIEKLKAIENQASVLREELSTLQ